MEGPRRKKNAPAMAARTTITTPTTIPTIVAADIGEARSSGGAAPLMDVPFKDVGVVVGATVATADVVDIAGNTVVRALGCEVSEVEGSVEGIVLGATEFGFEDEVEVAWGVGAGEPCTNQEGGWTHSKSKAKNDRSVDKSVSFHRASGVPLIAQPMGDVVSMTIAP
jgi:hypothetical protein